MAETISENEPARYEHITDGSENWSQESVDSLVINERLREAAINFKKIGAVARFALEDVALPADMEEYAKLDKNAILMITAITHDENELPISMVCIEHMDEKFILQEILTKNIIVDSGLINSVFGNYRVDAFYLLPIHFLMKDCKLVFDWAKNRDGFVLAEFPRNIDIDYLNEDNNPDQQNSAVSKETLQELLIREYCVVF